MDAPLVALTSAQIDNALASVSLSQWHIKNGAIERIYRTGGWKATLLLVNAVGHLCEVAWHHPELIATYDQLTIRLNTHDVSGISARDIALAEKIEAMLAWNPAAESGGALEGIPSADARFTYLKP